MAKRNPGKAKRLERRMANSANRANHRRLAGKIRDIKARRPRAYYAWRNRRRKNKKG